MEPIEQKIISQLSSSLEVDLASNTTMDELRSALTDYINHLIIHDFNKLVTILYRIDISERLLKKKLEEKGEDAAKTIAEMLIQRQIQKLKTRQQFRPKDDVPDEEKW